MSFGPSILGTPTPTATPPNAAPPGQPSTQISSEDRLLVAFMYLSYFTGFWLVVPALVYAFKRDTSRFVAHHALRAVIVHLLAIPVLLVSTVFYLVCVFGVAALLQGTGHQNEDLAALLVGLFSIGAWLVPSGLYLAFCVLATLRAAQGRVDTTSLLGRTVERWLGPDKAAAAPIAVPPPGH